MSNPSAGLMLVFLAAAVAAMLGAALFSGRLSAETRRRVELGLALVVYPIGVALLGWRAAAMMATGDKLAATGAVVFTLFIAVSGARVIWARRRRLPEGPAAS